MNELRVSYLQHQLSILNELQKSGFNCHYEIKAIIQAINEELGISVKRVTRSWDDMGCGVNDSDETGGKNKL